MTLLFSFPFSTVLRNVGDNSVPHHMMHFRLDELIGVSWAPLEKAE